ncbi:homeobox-leucine zipper protein ROC8-like isoform X1 [Zingiber officinale]|uniref:homeobox-leucine zipper protein ROC8-like isoform X1 n=1 Tax=Zingiber officinale TaxID=94328 RepID=UPI001C4D585B|nr:homeobox-leucine zipper protein ROC8-like isoform X1 [Zingiber officinale]
MDSGDDPDVPDSRGRKKRYHRHTPRQIQDLESMFKVCPHPDEKQRMQLSRDLGLEPRQIKFWFQNRRTQMKAQQDRSGNCWLRAENDKIRCENIAMRAALKNVICPSCGSSSCTEDSYFDEQKLRMDNSRLKEELDRVSGLASRYLGRPITQLPPVQSVSISSLDLSVGSYNDPAISTSLDLDLLLRNSSSFPHTYCASIAELEKPLMMDMASNAMEEVVRLVQADEPLWVKSGSDGREILQLETYERMFKRSGHQFKFPDVRIEASRDSAVVVMNATTLINIFMDASKWAELFPTIVSKARTLEVLASGMAQSRSGSLALIYEELQVLSPVVPTREFFFLRCCQQIQRGVWVIADVSVDYPRANELTPFSQSKRLPSGCLIEEMADGYSKVTWVEHVEIEESNQIPVLFKDLMDSGWAFGAQRWLTALQRMCDRLSCLAIAGLPARELGAVAPSPDGKRSMMKLAQRMVNNFCANISASNDHKWIALPGLNDAGVRVILHKSTDAGQPSGVLLSAATTIWFPISPESVFVFFKDERTRAQWDVLSNGNTVQEVTHIMTGSHPGNCISLLRGFNSGQNTMLILQECCTDALGSVVVYSPIDVPAINIVMSGEDPSSISLLPSGFTILPDGRSAGGQGASCSSNPRGGSSGSLVTVAFQILMSSLPSAKLNMESVMTVNNLIGTTVQQIKAALNCPDI